MCPGNNAGKRRILALCGAKSNNEVTRLQLENLNITDEAYEIHYLHGGIQVQEDAGDPELTQLISGPFFSWLDTTGGKEAFNESVVDAVHFVMKIIQRKGPFDGVYGFSQGGLVASLVAGIENDHVLQDELWLRGADHEQLGDDARSQASSQGFFANLLGMRRTQSERSLGASVQSGSAEEDAGREIDMIDASTRVNLGATSRLSSLEAFSFNDSAHSGSTQKVFYSPRNARRRSSLDSEQDAGAARPQRRNSLEQVTEAVDDSVRRNSTQSLVSFVLNIDDGMPDRLGGAESIDLQDEEGSVQVRRNSLEPETSAMNSSIRRTKRVPEAANSSVRRDSTKSLISSLLMIDGTPEQLHGRASIDSQGKAGSLQVRRNEPETAGAIRSSLRRADSLLSMASSVMTGPRRRASTQRIRRRTSQHSIFSSLQMSVFGDLNLHEAMNVAPFKFVIVVCGAVSAKSGRGMNDITCSSRRFGNGDLPSSLIGVKSVHLIGVEDGLRSQSERVASLFVGCQVIYMPGGHQVGREERQDKFLCSALRAYIRADGRPPYAPVLSEFEPVSDVSSVAIHPARQIANVQLNTALLPGRRYAATIVDCLAQRERERPFLYNARSAEGETTTYGQVLDFIRGGEGDLRRLGVMPGQVVAYVAPSGGSALGALAFLCFAAQTACAPLAPTTTEPDALDALKQFNADHLILFEEVDSPGVEAAYTSYSGDYTCALHRAKIRTDSKGPGRFEFLTQFNGFSSLPPLRNPDDGTALLLRTSGTTARPKVVQLKQSALVKNAAIIACSMQLKETDVCYSVMPLFHIGGLSASILCTMASGGSVCCDNETFDPGRMVDALATSNPQPTWYSSVPTIHNATVAFLKEHPKSDPKYSVYGIDENGVWAKGHSLRMIRSGAAALLGPDAHALSRAYGIIPIYPTYSMSEQMPISQPPAGKVDSISDRPGSVGVPVAANVVIVSSVNLRPQPFGVEGEVAISGETVMQEYLDNPEANAKSFFYLTTEDDGNEERTLNNCRYFLTGDLGVLDKDGFLYLKGRAKELIKKGGEQVSPHEVEEALAGHPWVSTALCVSVPSKMYGEEVGCAIVLSMIAPDAAKNDVNVVTKELRLWLRQKQLAPYKWPSKWKITENKALPRTKTNKLVRLNTAKHLGFLDAVGQDEALAVAAKVETRAKIDWNVITAFRFCLACYVMFMHIGSNSSWGAVNNLRGWPWHVHCFFTLGGFSMASTMNPVIKKKFAYFRSRISHMYPMYAMSLVFGLANLLVVCRPSTFKRDFHWDGQPYDLYQPDGTLSPLFCEGTPLWKQSYWGSLSSTVAIYVVGLAVTPLWPMNWWMGYYLWFMSMYFQCLALFPAAYNYLTQVARKNLGFLLRMMFVLQLINAMLLFSSWIFMKYGEDYNHYNVDTGEQNDPTEYSSDGVYYNVAVLAFYLFGPFWIVYFIIGVILAFIYDSIKPAEKHNAWIWGWVADACTLTMVCLSIVVICQGVEGSEPKYFRPSEANESTDTASINRLWDNIAGRVMCPVTTMWIFSLATGRGFTARLLRSDSLVQTLGPNSYGCFLFHQMVAQWYYAATRDGHWWNWWRYRKAFYWFSPAPCPVEWYEYFYVVGLVVLFSRFVEGSVLPAVKGFGHFITLYFLPLGEEDDGINIRQTLFGIIERTTGIEPDMDSTLDEVGLASVGIPVIVGMLNGAFSTKREPLAISQQDLLRARTIADIIEVVENARARMHHDGV